MCAPDIPSLCRRMDGSSRQASGHPRRLARAAVLAAACLGAKFATSAGASEPPAPEWERTFPGKRLSGWVVEEWVVQETGDRGYSILVALGGACEGGIGVDFSEIHIRRTDRQGDPIWSKTFGGEGTNRRSLAQNARKPLCQTRDGGYAVAAVTTDKLRLLRLDRDGETVWDRDCEPEKRVLASTIRETSDGGFIVCGWRHDNPFNMQDEGDAAFLLKIDGEGNEIWFRAYGDEVPHPSNYVQSPAYWGQETSDGGYVACGYHRTPTKELAAYLFKTDNEGNLQWSRDFEGELEGRGTTGLFVHETAGRGYTLLVEGVRGQGTLHFDTWLVHTDAQGHTLGGQPNPDWLFTVAAPTKDGGYILVDGCYEWHGFLPNHVLKTDATGNTLWAATPAPQGTVLKSVQPTSDGGYILTGQVGGPGEVYLAKLAPESPQGAFERGRTNSDDTLSVADAVCALGYLFGPAGEPCKESESVAHCLDAADANDDGKVDIADAITILNHLFRGAGPLPPPFGVCGIDPTIDELDCSSYPPCQ